MPPTEMSSVVVVGPLVGRPVPTALTPIPALAEPEDTYSWLLKILTQRRLELVRLLVVVPA